MQNLQSDHGLRLRAEGKVDGLHVRGEKRRLRK